MFVKLLKSIILSSIKYRDLQPELKSTKQAYIVWPWYIDINMHMNNADYLRVLEDARWDFFVKTGWFNILLKHRISAVAAAVELTYIRELPAFKRFTITTKLSAWTEKYTYFEQKIISGDVVYTHALIKIASIKKGRLITVPDLFNTLNLDWPRVNNAVFIDYWNTLAEEKKQLA